MLAVSFEEASFCFEVVALDFCAAEDAVDFGVTFDGFSAVFADVCSFDFTSGDSVFTATSFADSDFLAAADLVGVRGLLEVSTLTVRLRSVVAARIVDGRGSVFGRRSRLYGLRSACVGGVRIGPDDRVAMRAERAACLRALRVVTAGDEEEASRRDWSSSSSSDTDA